MRAGIEILEEVPGLGPPVERHIYYDFRLRMWLSRGESVRWRSLWGLCDRGRLEDGGTTLFTGLRVDRESMFAGLFYGVEGMLVGGTRKLRIEPHLAYREIGVPDVIPPNALIIAEVKVPSPRA